MLKECAPQPGISASGVMIANAAAESVIARIALGPEGNKHRTS